VFRTFLAVALAVTVFVATKDMRLLKETGLLGSCRQVGLAQGPVGDWWACESGHIDGKPDLSRRACVRLATVESVDFWSCPLPGGPAEATV